MSLFRRNNPVHKAGRKVSKEAGKVADQAAKKLRPQSRDQVERKLIQQLNTLEQEYLLTMEMERRFASGNVSDTARKRAEQNIELAGVSLKLVERAREDLHYASTASMLADAMNDLGASIKMLNRLYGASPEVRGKYLKRQTENLNHQVNEQAEHMTTERVLDNGITSGMDRSWRENMNDYIAGKITANELLQGRDGYTQERARTDQILNSLREEGVRPDNRSIEYTADEIQRDAEAYRQTDFRDDDYMEGEDWDD